MENETHRGLNVGSSMTRCVCACVRLRLRLCLRLRLRLRLCLGLGLGPFEGRGSGIVQRVARDEVLHFGAAGEACGCAVCGQLPRNCLNASSADQR